MSPTLDDRIDFDTSPSVDSLFPPTIETTRLRFERLCEENVSIRTLYTHLAHGENIKEATEYVLWSPHDSLRDTQTLLEEADEQWVNGNVANYIVRPQEQENGAGEIAGKAGLGIDWPRHTGELAVFLQKPFWGREYAGECFHALSEVAFEYLELEVVEAECAIENEQSRRALEKFVENHGGEYAGVLRNWRVPEDGDPLDSHHFSITQEQYQSDK